MCLWTRSTTSNSQNSQSSFLIFINLTFIYSSRYGWLKAGDIEVINSLAIPLGNERDPIDIPEDNDPMSLNDSLFSTSEEMFLLGVLLMAVLLLLVILCLYYRLQVTFHYEFIMTIA